MKIWQALAVLKELDPNLDLQMLDLFEESMTVIDHIAANPTDVVLVSCIPEGCFDQRPELTKGPEAEKLLATYLLNSWSCELQELPTGEWINFAEEAWAARRPV
jgi:hypothetical protein